MQKVVKGCTKIASLYIYKYVNIEDKIESKTIVPYYFFIFG